MWTQIHMMLRQPYDDEGIYWGDASPSQGMPRISGKHQKLKDSKKDSLLQVSEEAWPC